MSFLQSQRRCLEGSYLAPQVAEEPRRVRRTKGGATGSECAHDVRNERPERQGLAPTGATHPKPT